jgi:hypothetical protein
MQSVPITTNVSSWNPDHGKVYSMQHWCATLCDKVCQCLAAGRWLSPDSSIFSTNETDGHDKAEILLKVALYTIKPTIHIVENNKQKK